MTRQKAKLLRTREKRETAVAAQAGEKNIAQQLRNQHAQIKAATKRLQTAAINIAPEGQCCYEGLLQNHQAVNTNNQQSRQSWLPLRCGSFGSNWPRVWVEILVLKRRTPNQIVFLFCPSLPPILQVNAPSCQEVHNHGLL